MNNTNQIVGLFLLNLGVFFTTAAFLPRVGTFSYSNVFEQFINARSAWDIAWGATIGSSLLSAGLVVLLHRSDRG